VGDVVEVEDRVHEVGVDVFAFGRLVRGEHDHVPGQPRLLREDQFRQARAVGPESLGGEYLEDIGVGTGLDRIILAKTGKPRESLEEFARVLANEFFIVNVKRRRKLRRKAFEVGL